MSNTAVLVFVVMGIVVTTQFLIHLSLKLKSSTHKSYRGHLSASSLKTLT